MYQLEHDFKLQTINIQPQLLQLYCLALNVTW